MIVTVKLFCHIHAMTDEELKRAFAELRESREEAFFRPKENPEK